MNPSINLVRSQPLPFPSRGRIAWRLAWKEMRQLAPLAGMLLLLAVGMHCLAFFIKEEQSSNSLRQFALLGLPTLLAAGVGAMLVGQERETRTLQWMASLPIPGSLQAHMKLAVGALGLVAMWGLSLILFALSSLASQSNRASIDLNLFLTNEAGELSFYLLHSVFLLLAGLACAWYFQNTMLGLLGLVALTIVATLVDSWLADSYWRAADSTRLITQVVICLLTYGAFKLASERAYRPLKAPPAPSKQKSSQGYFEQSIAYAKILTPRHALIWQFSKQNRWILMSIAGLCLLGVTILVLGGFFDEGIRDGGDLNPVAFGCFFIAGCALGVIVFQGDSVHQRIRYLADRGVSPRLVWFSRHIIPFTILLTFTLVLATMAVFSMIGKHTSQQNRSVIQLAMLGGAAYAWVIYAASQWVSFVLRSAIVSTIVCPIVAVIPFIYGSIAVAEFDAPIVLLLACCLIPFIATYRTTQQWMELRNTKRFWMEHSAWLAAAILIPLVPFAYGYLTYPSITAAQRAQLLSDSKNFRAADSIYFQTFRIQPLERPAPETLDSTGGMDDGAGGMASEEEGMGLMGSAEDTGMAAETSEMLTADGSEASAATEQPNPKPKSAWDPPPGNEKFQGMYEKSPADSIRLLPMAERMVTILDHIEPQLSYQAQGLILEASYETYLLRFESTILRVKLQGPKGTEVDRDLYRRAMKTMLTICQGIRRTPTLEAQRTADDYDAWLFKELKENESKTNLGPENWLEIYEYLKDKRNREFMRYKSTILEWQKSKSSLYRIGQLGKNELANAYKKSRWKADRNIDRVVWLLTQYLNASDEATRDSIRKQVLKFYDGSNTFYQAPCISWFGKWESQIDTLDPTPEAIQ